LIDLRRRPKRSASDATPRILARFRRGLLVERLVEESAVAGREDGVCEDLLVKGTISSSARELAEIIRRISETGRWAVRRRDYTRCRKARLTEGLGFERVENIRLFALGVRYCVGGHGTRACAREACAPERLGGLLKKVVVGGEAKGTCDRTRWCRF